MTEPEYQWRDTDGDVWVQAPEGWVHRVGHEDSMMRLHRVDELWGPLVPVRVEK